MFLSRRAFWTVLLPKCIMQNKPDLLYLQLLLVKFAGFHLKVNQTLETLRQLLVIHQCNNKEGREVDQDQETGSWLEPLSH